MQLNGYADLLTAVRETLRRDGRTLIAIVGAPGSGKTTLVSRLSDDLENSAVLAMDGFHLDNETLEERGRLFNKGAPDTFDVAGLLSTVKAVRAGGALPVPTFDRQADRVVPDGGMIPATASTILIEGNYLLLDSPGWRDLHPFWDVTIRLAVSRDELERRLVQRWLDHGLSQEAAEARASLNDLPNADTVITQSIEATMTLSL